MKPAYSTKRIFFIALFMLLLIATSAQACGNADSPEAKAGEGTTGTYDSAISSKDKCLVSGCNLRKKEGFSYCSHHKCSIHYCPNKRMSTDFYCQSHHDAFKDIRDDYNGGSTSGYGNKSNTGGKSKKSAAQDDYYGTKDYSNAEDFADDWEDDFEDYDDAYEYYEEETGHY